MVFFKLHLQLVERDLEVIREMTRVDEERVEERAEETAPSDCDQDRRGDTLLEVILPPERETVAR